MMQFLPMTSTRSVALLAGALLVVPTLAPAQAPRLAPASALVDARYRAAAERGAVLVSAYMKQAQVPGMSVAVLRDGKIVWSQGFGSADLELGSPVTRDTRFRLGSLSKMLAAATLMKLAEAKKIDLDAPIQRYVPVFPERSGTPITARLLAGHLGGIRHYTGKDFAPGHDINQTSYATTTKAVAIFGNDSLVAAPGTAYRYSTFGYTLLGAAIEGAANGEFTAVERDVVLAPLGLSNTVPDRWDAIVPNRTHFYRAGPGGAPLNDQAVLVEYKFPAGGMLSTADDMVRFGAAHLRPSFFSAATLASMFTSQRTTAGAETHVGIGWRIGHDEAGRTIHHHAGSIEGGRSVLMLYPAQGVVIAVLSNRANGPVQPELMAQTIAAGFLPNAAPLRATRGATIATPATLKERAKANGLPMPDSLTMLPGAVATSDGELRVVASPMGLHPVRLRGVGDARRCQLVFGVDGVSLAPATTPVELPQGLP
jgi:CubicO group peptidase (beta-lactamase class C family)